MRTQACWAVELGLMWGGRKRKEGVMIASPIFDVSYCVMETSKKWAKMVECVDIEGGHLLTPCLDVLLSWDLLLEPPPHCAPGSLSLCS